MVYNKNIFFGDAIILKTDVCNTRIEQIAVKSISCDNAVGKKNSLKNVTYLFLWNARYVAESRSLWALH